MLVHRIRGREASSGILTYGFAKLDGILAVELLDDFVPEIGDRREVVAVDRKAGRVRRNERGVRQLIDGKPATDTGLSGRFRYLIFPKLPDDRAWAIHYDTERHDLDQDGRMDVTLEVVAIAEVVSREPWSELEREELVKITTRIRERAALDRDAAEASRSKAERFRESAKAASNTRQRSNALDAAQRFDRIAADRMRDAVAAEARARRVDEMLGEDARRASADMP